MQQASDLIAETFLVLRDAFFGVNGDPIRYSIKDKRNTQDDPLDTHIHTVLTEKLPNGIVCEKAPGPNTSPDLAVMRPDLCNGAARTVLASDLTRIAAIEVKKLERVAKGGIARAKGMDYNTTPPCGKIRIYDQGNRSLDIRGFYLYVSQQAVEGEPGTYTLSALALCDGNLLNEDFDLYLSITGQRTKQIGLGTYANGARQKPPDAHFCQSAGTPRARP
jgi:hypothetical protein